MAFYLFICFIRLFILLGAVRGRRELGGRWLVMLLNDNGDDHCYASADNNHNHA